MSSEPPNDKPPRRDGTLARDLTGDLFCLQCRYNLKGLSIIEHCPECSLPVKATLLAVVDPYADELTPLWMPRLTAIGMIAWIGGAFFAAIMNWITRMVELLGIESSLLRQLLAPKLSVLGLIVSAVGILCLVRIYTTDRWRQSLVPMLAAIAMIPMIIAHARLHFVLDAAAPLPYSRLDGGHELRAYYLLTFLGFAALSLALMRPVYRKLTARSIVLREGGVDRQPMAVLIASLAIAGSGAALHVLRQDLAIGPQDLTRTLEIILVALGSVLLTISLGGLFRDSIRLYSALASGPLGLRHVIGQQPSAGS